MAPGSCGVLGKTALLSYLFWVSPPHIKNGRYKHGYKAPLVDMLQEECSGYPFKLIKLKYAVGKNGFFNGEVSQVNHTVRGKNRARSAL